MTYDQEKIYFENILEYASIFNNSKAELIKNQKENEEKARNYHEYIFSFDLICLI